jgi:hypothetical protein
METQPTIQKRLFDDGDTGAVSLPPLPSIRVGGDDDRRGA